MNHDAYPDRYIRDILRRVRTIAMVGASITWNRPSNFAMKYLIQKGYRVIPVNPRASGMEMMGETIFPDLESVDARVDMVDMFRPVSEARDLLGQARLIGAGVFWMQLGLRDDAVAREAETGRMQVVMNRCPKIEYARLFGELGWNGINTGVIFNRRRRV